jgi:mannose-6-phosphate isomerase-like protein (cupin superfamily)
MPSPPDRLVVSPLADQVLDAGGDAAFMVAEWSDDGSRPGQPIAPLHVHHDEDEAWYVLEGRLRFRIGDSEVEAETGTAVFGPKGIPHTFANARTLRARYLLIMQPRTWLLLQALHDPASARPEASELYQAHGADLIDPDRR